MSARHFACAALALTLTAGAALAAKLAPLPTHNFVGLDLAWQAPGPPPPGQYRARIELVDADSAVRSGDRINFDTLEVYKTLNYRRPGGEREGGDLTWRIDHYQISCGWRSLRKLPNTPADFGAFVAGKPVTAVSGGQPSDHQEEFLDPNSHFTPFADTACAGLPLKAGRGAASAETAAAAWKDALQPDNTVMMITSGRAPAEPARMPETVYRFEAVQSEAATGNWLFLDRANLKRDGETVTGIEFAVLGPDSQRHDYSGRTTAALRRVRYDCANGSLSVLVQDDWDRYGLFFRKTEMPFAARQRAESPLIAADIAAACAGDPPPAAQSFPAMMDAWAFARAQWPQMQEPVWAACLWNHLPQDEHARLVAHAPSNFLFMTDDEKAALKDCGDTSLSTWRAGLLLTNYARQRAALATLAKDNVGEAAILALWNAIPWLDHQRYMRGVMTYDSRDGQFQTALTDGLRAKLGIDGADTAADAALNVYLQAQAAIENG